jgi:Polysaccharide pyruvyl transferase
LIIEYTTSISQKNTIMNTKSIGIITILKTNNYGAELQAFSFCHKLRQLGYEAEIIDYLYYKNSDFKRTKKAKPFVEIGLKRKIKEYLNPLSESLKSLIFCKDKTERSTRFNTFHSENTFFSKETYDSIDKLYNNDLQYDVYFVGSDQVWNPYSNINLEPYFLTFAPKNKTKISYASSFGVSTIPVDAHTKYEECLNNLSHIGVREEQGVQIVKDLTGRKAHHVLDPTLLLDKKDWGEVATSPYKCENYLLLYILTDSDYATKLAKKVAKDLNLNIVRICKNAVRQDREDSIINIIDAGPSEYVGLFMNASFVITNSFHGTAFSVNFEKSFYTLIPKHKDNNSRQESLLSTVGLKDRLIKEGAPIPEKSQHIVNFRISSAKLKKERDLSINYLLNAIEG